MTEDKGIFIKNIYYMLAYAFDVLNKTEERRIAKESFDNILDLFAQILYLGIATQLKQGLHRTYLLENEQLSTLRGKLNIPGTIRLRSKQIRNRLDCDVDNLTVNNIYNRILKTTAEMLIRNKEVHNDHRTALKKVMLFFTDVEEIDLHHISWKSIPIHRNNKSYQMLLYICYFIIKRQILTTEEGDYNIHSFDDQHMEMLFERFVRAYFAKHHKDIYTSERKVDWDFTDESETNQLVPSMEADIKLRKNRRTLIVDTKYYADMYQQSMRAGVVTSTKFISSNFYQINTYVTQEYASKGGLVDGMLLYAYPEKCKVPPTEPMHISNHTFYVEALFLDKPFADIANQLDQIASLIKNNPPL